MFVNTEHKANFIQLCKQRFDKEWTEDSEYGSAFYVLSHPIIFRKANKSVTKDYINFKEIFKQSYSSGEVFLIKASANLYSSSSAFTTKEMTDSYNYDLFKNIIGIDLSDYLYLDDELFKVFLNLLYIRKYGTDVLLEECEN